MAHYRCAGLRYCRWMTASPHHTPIHRFPPSLVSAALDAALSLRAATPVFGISGLQGSGKSTLAAQLAALGRQRGLQIAVLSLDDFYLSRAQRQALAHAVHPLLAHRGPPGTHDLGLALEVLEQLRQGRRLKLPRFDKLADERVADDASPMMHAGADLVVLEGWCLATPPQQQDGLILPINPLEREEDGEGIWRGWCNAALERDYPDLWQQLDALWVLQAPDFDVVPEWRWQQEGSLQSANPAATAMTRAQLGRFVQRFERVSRQALHTLPAIADRVIRLDAQRRIRA